MAKSKKLQAVQNTPEATPAPEAPKARTLTDIQNEYRDLCTNVGDKQYRAEILKAEIAQVNQRLLQLNQEAAALQAPTPDKANG